MTSFELNTGNIRPELLDALDPHQRAAVSALTGPVLVVAGPGSGKTRVLTHRLAALIDAGVWPSKLLAVTFTNKAAREMKERLAVLVGDDAADRATVSTFHSMCARLLRIYHEEAGLPRAFNILDSDDSARVVARVCQASGLTEGLEPAEVRKLAKKTHSAISRAKNANISAVQLQSSPNPGDRATGGLMAAYQQLMRQMGAIDFDDLLLYVLRLLTNQPDVAEKLRARWSFVSVDEFQDTNNVQYEIVTRLVADHHNVCVVGDADQSIYAFRGAQPSVVNNFTTAYPDTKVVILERNYRSTATICGVSKAVIEPNKAAFRAQQEPMAGVGEKAALTGYGSDWDEARAVVEQIQARGGKLSEHAILVRTNALTRSLENELLKAHLSFDVVGTLRFVERAEIKDALAWLQTAMNPANHISFERSISVPKRGVGAASVAKIRQMALDNECTPVEAAASFAEAASGKIAAAVRNYLDVLAAVEKAAATDGPVAALEVIFDDAGLRALVAERDRKEHTEREENLDQLLAAADDFTATEDDPALVTSEFLEMLALESSEDDTDDAGEKVQILTMHSAKGKEFDHVYVIGCEEQVLPHSRAIEEGDESLEEERRLFFVATSRAKKTLALSWCAQRMRFGKLEQSLPSRFLDDIPRNLLRVTDPAPAWAASGARTVGSRRGGHVTSHSQPRFSALPVASRAAAPKKPTGPRLDLSKVAAGVRVNHAKFGDGQIETVRGETADVRFDNGTVKTMMLTVAPMTFIDG